MFRKLLTAVGLSAAVVTTPAAAEIYHPYADGSAANAIYDLLFCDRLQGFRPKLGEKPTEWQSTLSGNDAAKVLTLANDASAESRVRALAFTWLRQHGQPVPKGILLGVIIEVPLEGGLDVLAVYLDGSIRYINQSGKLAIVEPGGLPQSSGQAKRMIELGQQVVARIGPWDKARLPPPTKPNVRLTFLVSDGLYFGQGPFEAMQGDPLSGPLLAEAAQLLQTVTSAAVSPG